MFLKKAELESSSDEADNADKVRPVRIPAPAGGGAEGVQRSSQYEERLSRARNSKTMAFRKTANAGEPRARLPGGRAARAGQGAGGLARRVLYECVYECAARRS